MGQLVAKLELRLEPNKAQVNDKQKKPPNGGFFIGFVRRLRRYTVWGPGVPVAPPVIYCLITLTVFPDSSLTVCSESMPNSLFTKRIV